MRGLDNLRAVRYTKNERLEDMSQVALKHEIQNKVLPVSSKRLGRPSKLVRKTGESQAGESQGEKKMTPTEQKTGGSGQKRIQRTVFDLQQFDDVKLVKDVALPNKPGSLEEALQAVGSDKEKLLDIIYKGLSADATNAAWEQIEGFKIADDSGEPGEDYTGKFADEEKGKLINSAILSIAKMQGYDKNLTKEKKRELKDKATEFLRSNPAMLQSIQG